MDSSTSDTPIDSINQSYANNESNVRYYCRSFPAVFKSASGSTLVDNEGKRYIDFFCGAGALNYGHNNIALKERLINYIQADGITHSLDFYTEAKNNFIKSFQNTLLKPRGMNYNLQFTGPTGANAVEAALKLARKITKRTNVIAFTNAFHGMSLGALSATTNPKKRHGAGVALNNVTFMPYENYIDNIDSFEVIERMLTNGSGCDAPAAFLIETIQGEGGLNTASSEWLGKIVSLAKSLGILVIIDDIQAGCGRTGKFFSFENLNIDPDIVCLSKSLSGYGLPFSMVLLKPSLDVWEPGEHNGTFRGNNLAFVTSQACIEMFWVNKSFEESVAIKAKWLKKQLAHLVSELNEKLILSKLVGRDFMMGVHFNDSRLATKICEESFKNGLIIETSGVDSQVVKFFPALTISDKEFEDGLNKFKSAVYKICKIA